MTDCQKFLKEFKILQDLGFENIKINAVLLNGINASTKDFNAWSEFHKN
jgi:cyclic pyranopterin phosphate synthase